MLYSIVLCYVTLYCGKLCYVMLCYNMLIILFSLTCMLCYVMSRCPLFCYAMIFIIYHAMLYYFPKLCAMLFNVTLSYIIHPFIL